jgi:hypothetical protein
MSTPSQKTCHFSAGSHICQVFSDDQESMDLIADFVLSGLEDVEKISCFSDTIAQDMLELITKQAGHQLRDSQLSLKSASETYFPDQCFSVSRMLNSLKEFYLSAQAEGFKGARMIGEMPSKVMKEQQVGTILEYEASVSLQLRHYPLIAVCQYDARKFDGETIMQILRLHPMMMVRGQAVRNPFFIPPEDYLRSIAKGEI